MRWAVGIDPGYRETGVVLAHEDGTGDLTVVAWATYACPKKGTPDVSRNVSLAGCVVNLLIDWIDAFEIKALDIGIELPVYSRRAGPQTLIKQARLLQEIESGIFHIVAGELDECWVTQVNPTTSKMLAGCSPKEKPVEQSPFTLLPKDISDHTRETLADAWAHSLSTWGIGGERESFSALKAATVRHVHAGPEDSVREYWEGFCQHIKDSEDATETQS